MNSKSSYREIYQPHLPLKSGVGLILLCGGVSIFTANSFLTTFSLSILIFLIHLLWIKNQPAIFLYCFIYQWAQSSTRVFQANFANLPLAEFDNSLVSEHAVYLALTSTLISSIIIARSIRLNQFNYNKIISQIDQIDLKKTFYSYALLFISIPIFRLLKFGGLTQLIINFEYLRWLPFLVYAFVSFKTKNGRPLLFLLLITEFAYGLTGFFSGFKVVIFYFTIIYLSIQKSIRLSVVFAGLSIIIALSILGLVWTSIKVDYRSFITGGARSQQITVNLNDRLEYLTDVTHEFG